jgi:hypothetical protein
MKHISLADNRNYEGSGKADYDPCVKLEPSAEHATRLFAINNSPTNN